MGFRLNISVCQSGMVPKGCCVNFPTRVGNLKALIVCWRESARRVHLSGNHAAVDHVQRVWQWRTSCSVRRTSQKGTD